jgi:hypothetical protein
MAEKGIFIGTTSVGIVQTHLHFEWKKYGKAGIESNWFEHWMPTLAIILPWKVRRRVVGCIISDYSVVKFIEPICFGFACKGALCIGKCLAMYKVICFILQPLFPWGNSLWYPGCYMGLRLGLNMRTKGKTCAFLWCNGYSGCTLCHVSVLVNAGHFNLRLRNLILGIMAGGYLSFCRLASVANHYIFLDSVFMKTQPYFVDQHSVIHFVTAIVSHFTVWNYLICSFFTHLSVAAPLLGIYISVFPRNI